MYNGQAIKREVVGDAEFERCYYRMHEAVNEQRMALLARHVPGRRMVYVEGNRYIYTDYEEVTEMLEQFLPLDQCHYIRNDKTDRITVFDAWDVGDIFRSMRECGGRDVLSITECLSEERIQEIYQILIKKQGIAYSTIVPWLERLQTMIATLRQKGVPIYRMVFLKENGLVFESYEDIWQNLLSGYQVWDPQLGCRRDGRVYAFDAQDMELAYNVFPKNDSMWYERWQGVKQILLQKIRYNPVDK